MDSPSSSPSKKQKQKAAEAGDYKPKFTLTEPNRFKNISFAKAVRKDYTKNVVSPGPVYKLPSKFDKYLPSGKGKLVKLLHDIQSEAIKSREKSASNY